MIKAHHNKTTKSKLPDKTKSAARRADLIATPTRGRKHDLYNNSLSRSSA